MSGKNKVWKIILPVFLLMFRFSFADLRAEAAQEGGTWENTETGWYFYDENEFVKTGWLWIGENWYFLNPDKAGVMMTGWQWIDGRCYYLADALEAGYPEGAMYKNCRTPDGYLTDASGAWVNESGVVEISGKGIQTDTAKKTIFSGRGGGGGSGGKSSGKHSSSSKSSSKEKDVTQEETAEPDCTEPEKDLVSPSEAGKVDWSLYFVEQGDHSHKIFKSLHGKAEEGTELTADFPETILGTDKHYYYSLISSPWSVIAAGEGLQKYYIEYRKGEMLPEEPAPDKEVRERLEKWLKIAKKADKELTGTESADTQIITAGPKESNERLLNLVSMADSTKRREIYLIAVGHIPNAAIISRTFRDVKNVSELVQDQFIIEGEKYLVLRVGFERSFEESTCTHDYELIDRIKAGCMVNGRETFKCRKCQKEESVVFPAKGHIDEDGDGICDICYEPAERMPEAVHYQIGDVQSRRIGEKNYLFRCIDEDYEDAMENSRKTALFLCDTVIGKKLNYGDNNNYKYSNVRKWLLKNASDEFAHKSYIGITNSYTGTTGKGTCEQLDENSLTAEKEIFQLLQDRVFLLSVEEALKYRDHLWKFNGSGVNNPKSEVSAYSRGYYLRTPRDDGLEEFCYGDGVYAVSLTDGNIQPVYVNDVSIGIRPAMAVPQG